MGALVGGGRAAYADAMSTRASALLVAALALAACAEVAHGDADAAGAGDAGGDAAVPVDAHEDAGPEPVYEPLTCDDAREGEIALGYQWVNDWIEQPDYKRHGRVMLIVDGSCRFYVYDALTDARAMRTGVLDAALLAEMNAELMTGPWASIDGVHQPGDNPDTAWRAVWRDGIGGSCDTHGLACAVGTPERLARLLGAADGWVDRLHPVGAEVTGPVRLYASSGERTGTVRREWTGATALRTLFEDRDLSLGVRLDHDEDAALLRAMRGDLVDDEQLALEDDGTVWNVQVLDETPFHDERGFLRPPFAVPGALPR